MKHQHKLAFALALVFVAGLGLGRLNALGTATSPGRAVALPGGPERAPPPAALPPPAQVAGSSISDEARDPVWADALSLDPYGFLEQSDFDWRGEPQEAADFVIAQMSDDEPAAGHPRGLVITSLLRRVAKTRLILPIREPVKHQRIRRIGMSQRKVGARSHEKRARSSARNYLK